MHENWSRMNLLRKVPLKLVIFTILLPYVLEEDDAPDAFIGFSCLSDRIYRVCHVSDKNKKNVCLWEISEFCLLSVDCSPTAAYTSLCRDQKYLLKLRYIILVYLNVTGFLIFETICLGRSKTLPMSENNITKINGICVW